MQRQLDTFNRLEGLSNALFGSFKQKGGNNNNNNNNTASVPDTAKTHADSSEKSATQTEIPPEPSSSEITSADSPGGQLLKSAETIFKGSLSAADAFIPHSFISEYINKDLVNEPFDQVAPNLANNIRESGIIVKAAIEDPRVRAALEAAIEVYGEAIGEAFDIAKPTIDKLVDSFWITIDNIGVKSARGATNAMIDTVLAPLAEIPILGGLAEVFVAGGKWFNAVASGMIAPTVVSNGEIVGKGIYMGREGVALADKYGAELENVTSNLTSAVSSASQAAESAVKGMEYTSQGVKAARAVNKAKAPPKESKGGHNNPFMIGGGSKTSKKKARRTSKRLLRSIRRFTKKRR